MTVPLGTPIHHPSVQAGLLMLVREILPAEVDRPRTLAEIEAQTGVSRARAYEVQNRLKELLPEALSRPGRKPAPPPDRTSEIFIAVRDYLMAHPGAVTPGIRRHYTPDFIRFALGLAAPGAPGEHLTLDRLADLIGVPYDTLKLWRYASPTAPQRKTDPSEPVSTIPPATAEGAPPRPNAP